MGVQTLKNAVFLATAVVAAVVIVQGAGPSVSPLKSDAASVTISSSVPASTASAEPTGLLKSASVGSDGASASGSPTSSSTSSKASASGLSASGSSYTATSASGTTQTFTKTPATFTAPTPTPSPTPTPAPTPTCPAAIGGSTAGAPGASDPSGIPGTTSGDIASFASEYNAIRVANCLTPIPFANIRYSDCLQQRLWWMADDPSTNPLSAWGHTGTAVRSDGVPIVGCDGDLAGGTGYTGASVADAWWASSDHRSSLYQPSFSGNLAGVCIAFAMSHGGVNVPGPNEPYSFTRAAAYWYTC